MGVRLSVGRSLAVTPAPPYGQAIPYEAADLTRVSSAGSIDSEDTSSLPLTEPPNALPVTVPTDSADGSEESIQLTVLSHCCDVLALTVRQSLTVRSLKLRISRAYATRRSVVPASCIRLVYNAKVLPESGSLESLGIPDGGWLMMATVRDGANRRFQDTMVNGVRIGGEGFDDDDGSEYDGCSPMLQDVSVNTARRKTGFSFRRETLKPEKLAERRLAREAGAQTRTDPQLGEAAQQRSPRGVSLTPHRSPPPRPPAPAGPSTST